LRRIDGWRKIAAVLSQQTALASHQSVSSITIPQSLLLQADAVIQ